MSAVELAPATIEAIARRVASLLAEHEAQPADESLLTATQLARTLAVSRSYVYEHAARLGAIPVGTGSRPRLRFNLDAARTAYTRATNDDALPTSGPTPEPTRRRQRRTRSADTGSILSVKGALARIVHEAAAAPMVGAADLSA